MSGIENPAKPNRILSKSTPHSTRLACRGRRLAAVPPGTICVKTMTLRREKAETKQLNPKVQFLRYNPVLGFA
jgi:hypothetical protein